MCEGVGVCKRRCNVLLLICSTPCEERFQFRGKHSELGIIRPSPRFFLVPLLPLTVRAWANHSSSLCVSVSASEF